MSRKVFKHNGVQYASYIYPQCYTLVHVKRSVSRAFLGIKSRWLPLAIICSRMRKKRSEVYIKLRGLFIVRCGLMCDVERGSTCIEQWSARSIHALLFRHARRDYAYQPRLQECAPEKISGRVLVKSALPGTMRVFVKVLSIETGSSVEQSYVIPCKNVSATVGTLKLLALKRWSLDAFGQSFSEEANRF